MGNYKKKKNRSLEDSELVGEMSPQDMKEDFRQAMLDAVRASDTGSILDKVLRQNEDAWKDGTILSFPDFCASADHMNFPPLSDRQMAVSEYMFGDNYKTTFDNGKTTAVLCWGKGSGKDTLSALMILYIVYLLLNMRNPQRFMGIPDNMNIDLLNVAASKNQAQTVYFQIFRTFVKNWRWLKNQWNIVLNGRFFSSGQTDSTIDFSNKVTITNDAVIFPGNIRAFSGSCESESLEGLNLLMFVLDEVDAFKTTSLYRSAVKIYRTARTSAASRFGNRYKGFLISYPRSANGFIMKMHEQSKKFLHMYGDKAKTWEVKPRALFSKETFEYEGYQIPMDFYDDFRIDPSGSKAAYLCEPPEVESLFFEDADKIEMATQGFGRPLFEFKDSISGGYVRKHIGRSPFMYDRSIEHIMLLDLSLKKDSTALTLMHRHEDKIIVDFSTAWVPDPMNKIEVDLQNVEDIIESVRRNVNIKGIFCDRWNSALLIQKMRSKGVKADPVKLEFDDFELFKRLLYAGNIQLPKHARLIQELKSLQRVTPQRVDHPEGGHNDMAVTIIMGVKMLAKENSGQNGIGLLAEGEFVNDNLSDTTDTFIDMKPAPEEGLQIDGFSI